MGAESAAYPAIGDESREKRAKDCEGASDADARSEQRVQTGVRQRQQRRVMRAEPAVDLRVVRKIFHEAVLKQIVRGGHVAVLVIPGDHPSRDANPRHPQHEEASGAGSLSFGQFG
ncbi:MAG: hypothetical protein M5R36_20780 [Deltaproteobacteria bacterium]|nr:hypothetical protein [Deltaproteobacteria bacterium]